MVTWNGDELMAKIDAAVMTGIIRAAERVKQRVVTSILTGPKTGRVYTRRGVQHQASAPGEAPASDTGNLAQRIHTDYDREALTAKIVSSADYAPHLELGTEKMEPRPHLRTALAAESQGIQDDVNAEIQAVLNDPAAGAMG